MFSVWGRTNFGRDCMLMLLSWYYHSCRPQLSPCPFLSFPSPGKGKRITRTVAKTRFVTICAHECRLCLCPMPFAIYKHKHQTTSTQVRAPKGEISALHSHYFPTESPCDFSWVTSAQSFSVFVFSLDSQLAISLSSQVTLGASPRKKERCTAKIRKWLHWICTDLNQLEQIQNGSCVSLYSKVKMGISGKVCHSVWNL